MPRPGPRRPIVALRLDDDTRARIEALAQVRGVNLSEQIRIMLTYAEQHMPEEWTDGLPGPDAAG